MTEYKYRPDEVYESPNFGYPARGTKGRQGHKIIGVVNHITGGEWAGNKAWLMNPNAYASYNVIVKRDGTVAQFVDPANAAWAHGRINKPNWPLLKSGVNPNLYTLAVARVGSNQNKWEEAQMDAIVNINMAWAKEHGFPPEWPHILGHKHIDSVNRWYCPGDPFLNELYVRLEEEVERQKQAEEEEKEEEKEKNVWYRVVAGSYRDRHNANLVRGALLRQGIGAWILPYYPEEE